MRMRGGACGARVATDSRLHGNDTQNNRCARARGTAQRAESVKAQLQPRPDACLRGFMNNAC